jgi:prepilin-type N-terminal cleavage/methylation domain-containing protein
MKNTKKNKGFTLIELLVVIAIIAILAGIVLVSLGSARDRSRKASLQSTMSSIVPVISMCMNDGGEIFAPTSNSTGGGAICNGDVNGDNLDELGIVENWPSLAGITGASYIYIDTDVVTNTDITAGTTGNPVVSCNVVTGSCNLVAQ